MAKEARSEWEKDIRVPYSDWKAVFKEEMMQRSKERNEREGRYKGVKYFQECYKKSDKKPWFRKITAERRFITTVNRIRANHFNLRESLCRKGYMDQNTCECGGVEDLRHVLFICEKYIDWRDLMYNNLEKARVPYPYDVEDWFRNVRIKPLEEVLTFLKNIKKVI